jgi:hypothetical protein
VPTDTGPIANAFGLAGARQPPLAVDEVAVHQAVAARERIAVGEAELMPELVQDGGEQVDVAGRHGGRIRLQPRRAQRMAELRIVHRRGVDIPAVARRIGIERDVTRRRRAEIPARHR